jgi:hypothetical protein
MDAPLALHSTGRFFDFEFMKFPKRNSDALQLCHAVLGGKYSLFFYRDI